LPKSSNDPLVQGLSEEAATSSAQGPFAWTNTKEDVIKLIAIVSVRKCRVRIATSFGHATFWGAAIDRRFSLNDLTFANGGDS